MSRFISSFALFSFATTIALVIVFTSSGIDRQTTLHLSSAGHLIVAIACAIAVGIVGWGYVRSSNAQTGLAELTELKRNAPGRWLSRGLVLVSVAAALSTVAMWYLLTVLVPYIPGNYERLGGNIEEFDARESRGRLCKMYGVVSLDSGGRVTFCYERGILSRRRISPEVLRVGDRVVVLISHTSLGTAILSITISDRSA